VVVRALRELAQPGAVRVNQPQVVVAVPIGLEHQLAAVRRPVRLGGVLEIAGQSPGRATARRYHPDGGDQVERDPPAVRGHGGRDVRALGEHRLTAGLGCCFSGRFGGCRRAEQRRTGDGGGHPQHVAPGQRLGIELVRTVAGNVHVGLPR
jgi:hypothetical protein